MADVSPGENSARPIGARLCRWPMPLALIWVVAPVAGILIRLSLQPIGPQDYWWHLAMGKLIAKGSGIPAENLFLYTLPPHTPFVDQPWLGQWIMYALYDGFGHAGPVVCRNLIAALTWAALVAASLARCGRPRVVGALGLVAAAVSGPVFGVRTQMFAFIPYVALVIVLVAVASSRWPRRWLLGLAPLTALWANLHGTFILAPVLVAATGGSLVVERWLNERTVAVGQVGWWTGTTVAVSLAAMINPLGGRIYEYVFRLAFLSEVSQTVTEWQPPDIGSASGVIILGVLVFGLVVLGIRRRQVRLFEAVLFAATACLAMGAVRQMFWWAAVTLLVLPRHIHALVDWQPWWGDETSRLQGVGHVAIVTILVAGSVLSQPGLWVHDMAARLTAGDSRRTDPASGLVSVNNPTRLVAGLTKYGYPGRIFHDQAVGGYLELALATETVHPVAFVDQRMALIPPKVWQTYFDISAATGGWRELLEAYDIRTLLVSPAEQAPLIGAVQADPSWTLVAVDEAHLLFMRANEQGFITRWRSTPSETKETSRSQRSRPSRP